MISVVVPCMNEERAIPIFYNEILKIQNELEEIEIIFVDDGSTDHTLERIKEIKQTDARVRYISFTRNFGKESALLAGLEAAQGNYVVTMDADLQDPPLLLPEMYRIVKEEGYDCVAAKRRDRKGEPVIRSLFSVMFYKVINFISSVKIVNGARDYRFMSRKMADAVIGDREYNRFSKGMYEWTGYNTKWIKYDNVKRSAGNTKWSIRKLFQYSIEGILAYSTLPLTAISAIGIILFLLSFFGLIFVLIRGVLYTETKKVWLLLVYIISLHSSLILICLGMIGLYLSKIYLEIKNRQNYIIREQA